MENLIHFIHIVYLDAGSPSLISAIILPILISYLTRKIKIKIKQIEQIENSKNVIPQIKNADLIRLEERINSLEKKLDQAVFLLKVVNAK